MLTRALVDARCAPGSGYCVAYMYYVEIRLAFCPERVDPVCLQF